MLVERAVEFGAVGERDHQARLAGMEIAQIVDLARCTPGALPAMAASAMASSLLVVLPMAETTTTGLRVARAP